MGLDVGDEQPLVGSRESAGGGRRWSSSVTMPSRRQTNRAWRNVARDIEVGRAGRGTSSVDDDTAGAAVPSAVALGVAGVATGSGQPLTRHRRRSPSPCRQPLPRLRETTNAFTILIPGALRTSCWSSA